MELYLHRLKQTRPPYPKTPDMAEFAAQFPYEPTPDQKQVSQYLSSFLVLSSTVLLTMMMMMMMDVCCAVWLKFG